MKRSNLNTYLQWYCRMLILVFVYWGGMLRCSKEKI